MEVNFGYVTANAEKRQKQAVGICSKAIGNLAVVERKPHSKTIGVMLVKFQKHVQNFTSAKMVSYSIKNVKNVINNHNGSKRQTAVLKPLIIIQTVIHNVHVVERNY